MREKGALAQSSSTQTTGPLRTAYLSLFPAAGFCMALLFGRTWAILSPDAGYYRMLAAGQRAMVPPPFSARILGPALAHLIGDFAGIGVDNGFLLLGVVSLLAILLALTYLLRSAKLPAAIFAAIFLMPLWIGLFHDYYLPDLLHAAILAVILACLVSGRVMVAMLLLFPAYLARESTLLITLCLVWAAWRRASLQAMLTGLGATAAGILVSRHYVRLAAVPVQRVSGAQYLAGKLTWSFLRNIFGLPLWANRMPDGLPSCKPMATMTLPSLLHFGAIRSVGLCHPSMWGPVRLLLAWFGNFGIGPAVAAACLPLILSRRRISAGRLDQGAPLLGGGILATPGGSIAFRFCVLYGIVSFLSAPLLGASVERLVNYAWPFFFLAVPWAVFASQLSWSSEASAPRFSRPQGIALILRHLLASGIAWYTFSLERPPAVYLEAGLAVLMLNLGAYVLIRRGLQQGIA